MMLHVKVMKILLNGWIRAGVEIGTLEEKTRILSDGKKSFH